LHQTHFAKELQTKIVSTLKLHKKLSFGKAARKILVKLTLGACIIKLYVICPTVGNKEKDM
jgi:hypothetical protein